MKDEGMSTEEDEEVRHENLSYDHENGELYAEDVSQHMIVLPEVALSTAEITVDDIKVEDLGLLLSEHQEKLRQLI